MTTAQPCTKCGRRDPAATADPYCPIGDCPHKLEAQARKRREEEERNRDLTDSVDLTAFVVTPEAMAATDGFFGDDITAEPDTYASDLTGSDTGGGFDGGGGDSGGGCSGEW